MIRRKPRTPCEKSGANELENYFLDTYALIEIARKNPRYAKFASATQSVTGELNLMELYYLALRDYGEEAAEKEYGLFSRIRAQHSDETMRTAMKMRLRLNTGKKHKLSYADAIGYQLSVEKRLKFVTGNEVFEGLESVEFVK